MEQTYMTEIDIQKVRHLSDVHIPFFGDDSKPERKHLILTGKNGSGKTSVLHALMQQLEYIVSDDYASLEECEKMVAQLEADLNDRNTHGVLKVAARSQLPVWKNKLAKAKAYNDQEGYCFPNCPHYCSYLADASFPRR